MSTFTFCTSSSHFLYIYINVVFNAVVLLVKEYQYLYFRVFTPDQVETVTRLMCVLLTKLLLFVTNLTDRVSVAVTTAVEEAFLRSSALVSTPQTSQKPVLQPLNDQKFHLNHPEVSAACGGFGKITAFVFCAAF